MGLSAITSLYFYLRALTKAPAGPELRLFCLKHFITMHHQANTVADVITTAAKKIKVKPMFLQVIIEAVREDSAVANTEIYTRYFKALLSKRQAYADKLKKRNTEKALIEYNQLTKTDNNLSSLFVDGIADVSGIPEMIGTNDINLMHLKAYTDCLGAHAAIIRLTGCTDADKTPPIANAVKKILPSLFL